MRMRAMSAMGYVAIGLAGLLWMGCVGPIKRADQRALSWQPTHSQASHRGGGQGEVATLASYLVKGLRSERAKARAIFRWITAHIAYDTRGYFTGRYGDLSPRGVLRRRRAVCDGYARLFLALAKAAGLEAVKINGLAKGVSGVNNPRGVNHAWNAVKIDGQWQLLDSTWAAGHIRGTRFVRRFTPHYFLTPPEQFAFTHHPKDPRWQLLRRPLSKAAFVSRIRVWPAFFASGLQLLSPRSQLHTTRTRATLWLKAPPHIHFTTALNWFDRKLYRRSYVRWQRVGQRVRFDLQLPYPGQYKLWVFVSPKRYARHRSAFVFQVRATHTQATPKLRPRYYRHCHRNASASRRCQVQQPAGGRLVLHRAALIKLRVPGARRVHLKLRGRRYPLRHVGGALFVGRLRPRQIGKAMVYAQFGRSQMWWGVVGFVVF